MSLSPESFTFLSIMTASFLGSLHCVGMCGTFAVLGCGRSSFGYHLGRLSTYLILGTVAGLLGKAFNLSLGSQTLEKPLALIVGGTFLLWGFSTLAGKRLPNLLRSFSPKAVVFVRSILSTEMPRTFRSYFIGLGTTLLPCGFLYSFVAFAALSGGALEGAQTMLFFWLGTLPLLSLAGGVGRRIFLYLGPIAPRIVALLFIISGAVILASHLPQERAIAAPCLKCHGGLTSK